MFMINLKKSEKNEPRWERKSSESLPWEVIYEKKEIEGYKVGFVVECEQQK